MQKKKIGEKGFTISELLMVFLVLLLVAGLLMPYIKYTYRRVERTKCANNLRNIGLALYIYAREHEGRFPASLETLYDEQYLADPKIMDCPADTKEGTPEIPDYIYAAGMTVKDRSLAPLVWDKAGNHGQEGKNVLYVNGAVGWEKE